MAKSKAPKKPLETCKITCTRFSTRESDYDNLVASFKPIIDGLKDAGIILDDNDKCIVDRKYLNGTAKRNKGFVQIIVEEVE